MKPVVKISKEIAARCYLCGNEEPLKFVEFSEWVCEKDYDKVMRRLKKLKQRRTRYTSPKTFLHAHGIETESDL